MYIKSICRIALREMRVMKKHAYLIMAHNEWNLLNKLIKCIDDERNDIFLHIDCKANPKRNNLYKPEKSKLFLIKRTNVQWGGGQPDKV